MPNPAGKRLLLLFVAVLASGCELELCPTEGATTPEVVSSSEDTIIGGVVDEEHHATVALLLTMPDGGKGLCSGTIIAKAGDVGYVLTAAHCVQGTVDHVYEAVDWRDCTPSGDPSGCRASYTPVSWQAHPEYDDTVYTKDFAIVMFSGATGATPVVPVAGAEDGLALGDAVTLSGFGRTYAGEPNGEPMQSLRHQVTVPIASEGPAYLRFDASTGKTACFGDSGGPAYAGFGGSLRVAGVASTADATCSYVATYRRVSDVYQEFIAPILPPSGPPCEGCGGGGGSAGGGDAGGAGGAGGHGGDGGDGRYAEGGDAGGGEWSDQPCVPLEIRCSAAPGEGGAPCGLLGLLLFLFRPLRRLRWSSAWTK